MIVFFFIDCQHFILFKTMDENSNCVSSTELLIDE